MVRCRALSEGFWASLRAHPVPVREEAISAIGTRSMAIDIYIWLAHRLHALNLVRLGSLDPVGSVEKGD